MLGAHPGHRRNWGHRTIRMGARDKKQLFFPGQWVLDCRVVRLLGRGGIAEVYEVLHKGERFALKIIQSAWIDDEVQAARMVLEGELLSMIRHPHVVDVQEAGVFEHAGKKLVWLRMELLHGRTLREEMCQREELLSVPLICAYLWQSALGAHQCHVLGAVHRDIKPENLFVTPGPVIKLLDFGLAKLLHGGFETGEGQRLGTPLYMSPEQIRGQSVTPAADVYALAVVGWEMFAGINPFVDDPRAYDLRVLYHRHFSVVPPPLTNIGVPLPIADVIARGLEKSPRLRPQNGLVFAREIEAAFQRALDENPRLASDGPGDPSPETVAAFREDGLRFGTGPTHERISTPMNLRRSRPSMPGKPVLRAVTERLPPSPPRPAAAPVVYLSTRTSSGVRPAMAAITKPLQKEHPELEADGALARRRAEPALPFPAMDQGDGVLPAERTEQRETVPMAPPVGAARPRGAWPTWMAPTLSAEATAEAPVNPMERTEYRAMVASRAAPKPARPERRLLVDSRGELWVICVLGLLLVLLAGTVVALEIRG